MLQSLEWEPSGSFFQPRGSKIGQNGAPGPSHSNHLQDIIDHTLPPNPRKTVLYRPSVTHFIAVSMTAIIWYKSLCDKPLYRISFNAVFRTSYF